MTNEYRKRVALVRSPNPLFNYTDSWVERVLQFFLEDKYVQSFEVEVYTDINDAFRWASTGGTEKGVVICFSQRQRSWVERFQEKIGPDQRKVRFFILTAGEIEPDVILYMKKGSYRKLPELIQEQG